MWSRLIVSLAPWLFVVMWATGFVVARLSAPHVDPVTFLAIRFPIAGFLFAAIALALRAPWPNWRDGLHGAVAGALMHTVYLAPIYWAVAHGMPAGVAALIVGLQPLLTVFFAAGFIGERVSIRHCVGLLVGISGVALVLSPKLVVGVFDGLTPVTVLATLIGTIGISFGTVYQKRFATGLHIASGGAWQYLGASIVAGPLALGFEDLRFDGSFNAWFALFWSVVVLSLGAITLLMMLIREGAVGKVSSLIFLVPGVAALMTYVLYDESLTFMQIIGMAVCAAAVLSVNWRALKPEP